MNIQNRQFTTYFCPICNSPLKSWNDNSVRIRIEMENKKYQPDFIERIFTQNGYIDVNIDAKVCDICANRLSELFAVPVHVLNQNIAGKVMASEEGERFKEFTKFYEEKMNETITINYIAQEKLKSEINNLKLQLSEKSKIIPE